MLQRFTASSLSEGNERLGGLCRRNSTVSSIVIFVLSVVRKYFFYFSFENANCADYVTEKLYNSWQFYFAVPIVIKREIYTNMGV